jgi:hypothetical protein
MGVRKPGLLVMSLNTPVDIELVSVKNGQAEIPGPNKDTIQNHLCLLPDQLSIFIHYLSILILTIAILAIHAFVVTSKGSSSFSRSAHSSSAHLLPTTEIKPTSRHHRHHNPPQGVLRLRPTTRTQTSPFSLLKNQPSPALLQPSSRSSSPFKPHQADNFAPALHIPVVISGPDEDDDDWGMPSTSRRPPSRRRGVVGGICV